MGQVYVLRLLKAQEESSFLNFSGKDSYLVM